MTNARIYQKLKNAMQSGRAGTQAWVLEYEPAEAQRADPLMGWAGSGDTRRQVTLKFPSQAAAETYAKVNGLTAQVTTPPQKLLKLQAYADNFR
jgi:ETC complex I subunit conserved region